jgi:hypothetical protein
MTMHDFTAERFCHVDDAMRGVQDTARKQTKFRSAYDALSNSPTASVFCGTNPFTSQ